MLKHGFLLVACSIAAIFFKSQLAHILQWLTLLHNKVVSGLSVVFSNDATGAIIQNVIALILIPVVAGGIVALGFYIVKKHSMPHTVLSIWIVWTVLLVTLLAQIG